MASKMTIKANTRPAVAYLKTLQCFLEVRKLPFDLSNLPFELFRAEVDKCPTGACELIVSLYPSDSFLSFVATSFAGHFDFDVIEK